jgi:hypothetical protein
MQIAERIGVIHCLTDTATEKTAQSRWTGAHRAPHFAMSCSVGDLSR